MQVFITRHGKTDWNNLKKCQGTIDTELNNEGIEQAEQAAEYLHKNQISLDYIFSSPLKRAKKTAEVIASAFNIPVITDKRLTERNFGKFEGMRLSDFEFDKIWFYNSTTPVGNEELMKSCFDRAYSFLDELSETEIYTNSKILIVTHFGMSIPFMFYPDKPIPLSELTRFGMGNCFIKKIF